MALLYTDEQIRMANNTNIVELAKSLGYESKQQPDHSFRISHMSGLIIDKNCTKWHHFSDNIGGGAIQFLMNFSNLNWKESVASLLGLPNDYQTNMQVKTIYKKAEEKKPFTLPEKSRDGYKKLFAYLIKTRKIDKVIGASLFRVGKAI